MSFLYNEKKTDGRRDFKTNLKFHSSMRLFVYLSVRLFIYFLSTPYHCTKRYE